MQAFATVVTNLSTDLASAKQKNELLEARMTDHRSDSIHAENRIGFKNIRDELREKVSVADLPKFKKTEPPIVHIRAFKAQMNLLGLDPKFWPSIFPQTLDAASQVWFYYLDPRRVEQWDQIAIEFYKQYQDNIGVQPTVRSLEVLTMKPNEGFTEYMACGWLPCGCA